MDAIGPDERDPRRQGDRPERRERGDRHDPLRISCDDCVMQGTEACRDCVVTFICSRDPDDAVIIDAAEERAVRLLIKNGLVPRLRHESTAS